MRRKQGKMCVYACIATLPPLFNGVEAGRVWLVFCLVPLGSMHTTLAYRGIFSMRKIVLAAAVAGSAFALAACSETADSAADTADAMAADVEANTEAAADVAGEAADTVAEVAGEAADTVAEAADEAAAAAEAVAE